MATNIQIYDPIKDRTLDKNHCFLCGAELNETNYTQEHIFPKWLLNKFNLWNERLTLLNGRTRQYKKIKIPCCKQCNEIYLGRLENTIQKASKGGYEKFSKVSKQKIFLWLQKIYYQILFLELRLLFDPARKEKGSIIDEKMLSRYSMCHTFLQATRIKTEFHKPHPWSIFVFKVQEYEKKELNFDFKDNFHSLTYAIRMGDIGIIACLQDNNTQEQFFGDDFRKIKRIPLHPMQFNELIARVFYKESLKNRVPKYIVAPTKDHLEILSLPLGGLSSKPIYDDWVDSEYAKILSFFCNREYDQTYKPPDKVWTILYDEKQRLRKLDIKTCGF